MAMGGKKWQQLERITRICLWFPSICGWPDRTMCQSAAVIKVLRQNIAVPRKHSRTESKWSKRPCRPSRWRSRRRLSPRMDLLDNDFSSAQLTNQPTNHSRVSKTHLHPARP